MKVVIVGAGINGLVAANYLARAGFDVTILEYKDHAGGACTAAYWEHDGEKHVYPQGASVLGFMEDFVFEETGLSKRVTIARPEHPEIIYHGDNPRPLLMRDDAEQMAAEARKNWGETGKVKEFYQDLQKVVDFLRQGYRYAVVPTLDLARHALGDEIVRLFITGSARALLDHYLTSDALKLFYAVDAIESGPVSLDSPYSAFSIALMSSGSIFDGEWGYVKDGIWQVPLALDAINAELGVKRIFGAKVSKVLAAPKSVAVAGRADEKPFSVYFENVSGGGGAGSSGSQSISADYVFFATDPFSAAKICGNQKLLEKISSEKLVGTSGKLVMFFKKPVQWKDSDSSKYFDASFMHIIPAKNLSDLEQLSNAVLDGKTDFTPGYFEIYCEGAGNRLLFDNPRKYELVSVFFKNLALSKTGEQLPEVKKKVEKYILEKIANPEDFAHSILETPKDLQEMFSFPGGNIDDVDLAAGQTFFQRNYSPDPVHNFYQFGSDPRIFYCAAGTYPCGSVAGTPGYMCAKQLIRKLS